MEFKLTEDDILVKNILTKNYLKDKDKRINIYLLGHCSNNCNYCYLKKYESNLFPAELNNFQKIENNFQIFLNWYVENKLINPIDIFSGEWLTITNFRNHIFDILINTFMNVSPKYRPYNIVFPDSMRFVLNDIHLKAVEDFIAKMFELNIKVYISASIDGKYADINRYEYTDEEYDKIFAFMKKYNYFYHPMISSSSIKNQIKNYLWWKEQHPKISSKYKFEDIWYSLEIRENNWKLEDINEYLKYLNFIVDDMFNNVFNKNKTKFLKYIMLDTFEKLNNPLKIPLNNFFQNKFSCSYSQALTIRIADLALTPCHRLSYPELIYGHFLVDNNKIIGIKADKAEILIMKEFTDKSTLPHCENCQFSFICLGFCAGAAYENCKNPLIPPKAVCDLQIARYTFLILKYYQLGLWDEISNLEFYNSCDLKFKYLKDLIDNIIESTKKRGLWKITEKEIKINE